jgi:hypothetical protein
MREVPIKFAFAFLTLIILTTPSFLSYSVSAEDEVDNWPESDAWLHIELVSWSANETVEWDNNGGLPDPHFQICIEADGDNIDCINTPTWDDQLTLNNSWNHSIDIPDYSNILNITIECRDNDALNDDECDMNSELDEWKLYAEYNWSVNPTLTVIGNGDGDENGTWKNAASEWRLTIGGYGDEDSDGVEDSIDNCPTTSLGAAVDSNGCDATQRDSDNDGVSDAQDNWPEDDAWLYINLISWSANQTVEWDNNEGFPDPHFQICIEADGDNIDCINTPTWDNQLELVNPWNYSIDIPDYSNILNITIECRDDDALNDDECDMNSELDEWKLYAEYNWSVNPTLTVIGNGDGDENGTWKNAASEWRFTVGSDSDDDGVVDASDDCPNTTRGESVSPTGCPMPVVEESSSDATSSAGDTFVGFTICCLLPIGGIVYFTTNRKKKTRQHRVRTPPSRQQNIPIQRQPSQQEVQAQQLAQQRQLETEHFQQQLAQQTYQTQQLEKQLAQQTHSATQMNAMQAELAQLQESKAALEKELEDSSKSTTVVQNITYNIQDSAISGDINANLNPKEE